MDNAEEIMQLLEEFSKMRPKEIPRELEEYLGYVAKTGDPVFQWSLVKSLFREKLVAVVTDFYESTLTMELPPCPNVDPFNYERMKTCLLERLDTFTSAPFTIQRICELLTNPRKEYNRADKYMRAIEKNILVVSTREPGSCKRPLECDGQSEAFLNGIPDVKSHSSDGSMIHVPTDLPYLGAPPASNDVTVETSESDSVLSDRVGLSLDNNVEDKSSKSESSKLWQNQELSPVSTVENEPQTKSDDSSNTTEESIDQPVCNTSITRVNTSFTDSDPKPNASCSTNFDKGESSGATVSKEETTPFDSIDSSDSSPESSVCPKISLECEETGNISDENEVSSTPSNTSISIPEAELNVEQTTEAEAAKSNSVQDAESIPQTENLVEQDIDSSNQLGVSEETESITEVGLSVTNVDKVDLECNEITGTVVSPISPENSIVLKIDDLKDTVILETVEESENRDSNTESSTDLYSEQSSAQVPEEHEKTESSLEADPASSNESKSEVDLNVQPDINLKELPAVETVKPEEDKKTLGTPSSNDEGLPEQQLQENVIENASTDVLVSEERCTDSATENKLKECVTNSEVAEEMLEQERRGETVIQLPSNTVSDDQKEVSSIEEDISIDPSCEAEEAMDVDDTSNQMMVSEGENEGEPMDQSEQQQS